MPGTKATARQARGDRRYTTRDWSTYQVDLIAQRLNDLSLKEVQAYLRLILTDPDSYPEETKRRVITRGLQVLLGKEPRPGQVAVLMHLIYGLRDVLLIARTGFGKSIIFVAFGVLTGWTSIIVVPLIKLGEEQVAVINRVEGAHACMVDGKTKYRDPELLSRIQKRLYTHVVMGPEQAMSPEFKAVVRDPDFQRTVGMVAFDEIHLLLQWRFFRTDYVLLEQLRHILPPETVWFGCTATLTEKAEAQVKTMAGFKEESPTGLHVERTSIDRPEIALSVIQIRKNKGSDYSPMLFVFNNVVGRDGEDKVLLIPKTVVFVDSHRAVNSVAEFFVNAAACHGIPMSAIRTFTSRVSSYDKEVIYQQFCSEESRIRIVVATTSLGMGMDMPDVEIVIQWGMLLSRSLSDLWQRFGRAARQAGRKGSAIAYLPASVWEKPPELNQESLLLELIEGEVDNERPRKRTRNTIVRASTNLLITPASTQGRMLMTPVSAGTAMDDDALETQSNASCHSNVSMPSNLSEAPDVDDLGPGQQQKKTPDKKKKTAKKLKDIEELKPWYEAVKESCFRKAIVGIHQEDVDEARDRLTCCNKCNPALEPKVRFVLPPPSHPPLKLPSKGSRAGLAYAKITAWCEVKAKELRLLNGEEISIVPSQLFLPTRFQLALAKLFNKRNMRDNGPIRGTLGIANLDRLKTVIPEEEWVYFATHGQQLIEFLYSIRNDIIADHEATARRLMPPPSQMLSQMSSQRTPSQRSLLQYQLTPLSELSQPDAETPTRRGPGRPRRTEGVTREPQLSSEAGGRGQGSVRGRGRGRGRGMPLAPLEQARPTRGRPRGRPRGSRKADSTRGRPLNQENAPLTPMTPSNQ